MAVHRNENVCKHTSLDFLFCLWKRWEDSHLETLHKVASHPCLVEWNLTQCCCSRRSCEAAVTKLTTLVRNYLFRTTMAENHFVEESCYMLCLFCWDCFCFGPLWEVISKRDAICYYHVRLCGSSIRSMPVLSAPCIRHWHRMQHGSEVCQIILYANFGKFSRIV